VQKYRKILQYINYNPHNVSISSVRMTPLTCEYNQSKVPVVRSPVRDTFFYASDDRDTLLGGLDSPGITNYNFDSIMQMVCVISDTFRLLYGAPFPRSGDKIT